MQAQKPPRRIGWYSVFLHLALVALSIQVVVLSNRGTLPEPIERVAIGDVVEPFAARDLAGGQRTLDPKGGDRDTLLLVFTTSCPACQENIPSWVELWERYQRDYEIVGVSVDEPEATVDYVARNLLPFPVVVPDDSEGFPRRYGIPGVPHTLWLSPEGRVREVWGGILGPDQLDELAHRQAEMAADSKLPRDV